MRTPDYEYEKFFDLSPDLMCIAGFDGYFKKVNPAVAKTLGYSFDELYARPINDFVHPADKEVTAKVRQELHRSKPLHHFENKYVTKGGETVWLSWTSLPVESDQVVFAVAKNVTHKKKVEEDRNALLASVTRINRDLLKLNYATSDDLKIPVDSLLALFDLLDLSRINDPDTLQLLELVKYAAEKTRKTLNNHMELLTAKGRDEVPVEATDLQTVLDQVLESTSTLVHTSQATINADFSKAPAVWFHPPWMKSILLNLITNAIKYARPDHPPVISIRTEVIRGKTRLVIADNGAGLAAGRLQHETRDFPSAYQRDQNHSGIGLYLAHHHVAALGGEMDIRSKVDEGTVITIAFK